MKFFKQVFVCLCLFSHMSNDKCSIHFSLECLLKALLPPKQLTHLHCERPQAAIEGIKLD